MTKHGALIAAAVAVLTQADHRPGYTEDFDRAQDREPKAVRIKPAKRAKVKAARKARRRKK